MHFHEPRPLTLEAVVKSYGAVRAVDTLDLFVAQGSAVGLVGPNGSGKTTALRAVVGLVEPDSGRVVVNGFRHPSILARRNVAYVPDEPTGFDELTVREFLALYASLYRAGSDFERRSSTLLAAFRLDGSTGTPLASLSHGMRRQVTMAAAFALAARLTVIDEATAALDPESVIVLREMLRARRRSGGSVLVATQDLNFAELACDRLYLLARGRLVAEGSIEALRRRFRARSLEEAFLNALGQPTFLDELHDSLEAL